ncbi:phage tail assembly chaperone [Litorimonas sp. RW-G-Af-16]|uniref:phage tail assembly chaperone n=1 Tax=Litorimonas sp. RW-G-Af-16 TaxID=3241168 RepID=UPI00390C4895
MRQSDWPFEAWLRFAVRQMNMPPNVFWGTSVHDWFTILNTSMSPNLNRAELDILCQKFPDEVDEL